jgi:hypothetical protein
MVWQHIRFALLAGALASTLTVCVRADEFQTTDDKKDTKLTDDKKDGKVAPKVEAIPAAPKEAAAPAASCCGTTTRKIMVEEWVPETYTAMRTVYRTESRQENYTAYKEECVPETRTRTYTVNHMVPEVKEVIKTHCVKVPVVEERTCMETRTHYETVTKYVSKCVDHGHYECREVPCGPSFSERLHKLCRKSSCCDDPCAESCCPATKTVKVWVSCKVTEQVPVCCRQKVCEQVPVKKCVTTYRTETRQEVCHVTCYKCVPECKTETYTVQVKKCIPYTATRTVCVCVPHQEACTMTRCVKRCVEKEVAVTCGCESSCETSCCESSGGGLRGLFHRSSRGCCK